MIAFDLDDTLTLTKSTVSTEMAELLVGPIRKTLERGHHGRASMGSNCSGQNIRSRSRSMGESCTNIICDLDPGYRHVAPALC